MAQNAIAVDCVATHRCAIWRNRSTDLNKDCGLIERSESGKREAAKLLINSDSGCDMILHGEKVDHVYREMMDILDFENRHRIEAARKLWGIE
jgi:hypothetical protein